MKKNLNLVTVIAIIGLAAFAGCTKSSSSSNGSISATINGKSFSGNNCGFSDSLGFLSVTGFQGAGATFAMFLWINNYTAGTTGTFSFNTDTAAFTGATLDSGVNQITARRGVITVTSASSSQVTGTFSFTCSDSTVVSGGSFTAKK